MTPAARLGTAIELLDAVIDSAREGGAAADTLIQRYFADRRYAGSGDRRAIRELVYDAIRRTGDPPPDGRTAMIGLAHDRPDLAALFDGSRHAPLPIGEAEQGVPHSVVPSWLKERLAASQVDAATQRALLSRAPLDLRVNRLKTTREAMLGTFADAVPTAYAPDGLRLPAGTLIDSHPTHRAGFLEVQDEGSQLVTLACAPQPDMAVVDLCAGAGGKTLALAALMENRGAIIACDTDRARLSRLAPRAGRAGVTIATTRLLDPGREAAALVDVEGRADLVVVDAPCSGSGTWRRNPEARWRLTPDRLATLVGLQARLLALGARLTRPGGALTYIVCSLLDGEGAEQVSRFLADQSGWQMERIDLPAGTIRGPGLRLDPLRDSTDGFFVARLRRA